MTKTSLLSVSVSYKLCEESFDVPIREIKHISLAMAYHPLALLLMSDKLGKVPNFFLTFVFGCYELVRVIQLQFYCCEYQNSKLTELVAFSFAVCD